MRIVLELSKPLCECPTTEGNFRIVVGHIMDGKEGVMLECLTCGAAEIAAEKWTINVNGSPIFNPKLRSVRLLD